MRIEISREAIRLGHRIVDAWDRTLDLIEGIAQREIDEQTRNIKDSNDPLAAELAANQPQQTKE
jgi:hypothetical protein